MKAVFFDLFETLITEKTRSDAQARTPWHERLRTDAGRLERWWKENHVACMTGHYPDIETSFQALCLSVESPLSAMEVASVIREQCAWKTTVLREIEPCAEEMIHAVQALGLKVGVLSNALPEEVSAWDSCPLRGLVDDAVFSCAVGVMKPQPTIYALACERMGIPPADACFIGDGGFDELRGAKAVGMTSVKATWYQNQKVDWPFEEELREVATMEAVIFPQKTGQSQAQSLCECCSN